MFLIACQKETAEEKGLICCLYSYVHMEGIKTACRGCCYVGFNQYMAGTGQAIIQLAKQLCCLPEHK